MIFDFIRGGQILNNRIKEGREVLRVTAMYSLILTLIILAVRFKRNLNFNETKNAFNYYIAERNVNINQADKMIRVDIKTLKDFGFNVNNLNKNKDINSNRNKNNNDNDNGGVVYYSNSTNNHAKNSNNKSLNNSKQNNSLGNNITNTLNAPKIEIKSIDIINNNKFRANKEKVFIFLQNSFTLFFVFYIMSFFVIIAIFITKGYLINQNKFLRGARIVPLKYLNKIVKKYNRKNRKIYLKKKKSKYNYYKIANAIFPVGNEMIHTFITGGSGSGKTTLILDLIEQIRKNGDRAIIYDGNGDFISKFYNSDSIDDLIKRTKEDVNIKPERKEELYKYFELKRDVIINPLDDRSCYWSIFNEVRNKLDFDSIAGALIPDGAGNLEGFWIDAARILFSSVASSLKESGKESNKDLVDKLLKIDLSEAAPFVKGTPAAALLDERHAKLAISVMAAITTNLKPLLLLRDKKITTNNNGEIINEEKPFSIRQWIQNENQEGFLFISSRKDIHRSIKPLISTWLEIGINSLLSLEPSTNRKIWIIMDELPSLHYLPSLDTALAEARKSGGCIVMGMQNFAQLRAIYGKDKAEATSGLGRNRIILNTPDEDTARWCSDNLGKAEIKEVRESQSFGHNSFKDGVSINTHDVQKNIVLPTEIMQLENLTAYIKFGGSFPIALSKFKYKYFPEIAPRYVEGGRDIDLKKVEKGSDSQELNTDKNIQNNDVSNSKEEKLSGFMSNSYVEENGEKKDNNKKKETENRKEKIENSVENKNEEIKVLDTQEIDPLEDLN